MQTKLIQKHKDSAEGQEAEAILRNCVHCGFCTATCPTYQLLGDELDGPRGRIYLIKQVLEGQTATKKTQTHLDRCLTCRACETTCPSGVNYGRLADIGRHIVEQQVPRTGFAAWQRQMLNRIIPNATQFNKLLTIGRILKPVLPSQLKQKIPPKQTGLPRPTTEHKRKMLIFEGCVQPATKPLTNDATAIVLDQLGIQLISSKGQGCCGAVSQHLSFTEDSLRLMRANIDAWWPYIEQGIEAIVTTASGCGVTIKDYAELLQHDPDYADKATKVSALSKDLSEILIKEDLSQLEKSSEPGQRVAFHSPCTLQHGQSISGSVERILARAGYELVEVTDSHLCCGSAGSYSLLQPTLSKQLLSNKLSALQQAHPDVIATANIGCQLHLDTQASAPVKHWIELLV
jgi:glycolate oxidase iron-sulfur subunit